MQDWTVTTRHGIMRVYRNLSKTNVYLKVSVNSRLKKHLKIIDQRKALNLAVPVKTLLT